MKRLSFDKYAEEYDKHFNQISEEIAIERGEFPFKATIEELRDLKYSTNCGVHGNEAFSNVSLDGDHEVVALMEQKRKEVSGMVWVDFDNLDQAEKFRDEIEEAEGSIRLGGPRGDGFLFEIE